MTKKSILLIKPTNKISKKYYSKHLYFHDGDSGLDLYVLEDTTIGLGETLFIDLGIQCEMLEHTGNINNEYKNVSFYMYPRSSLSKYPFILGNHQGIIDAGYRGNLVAAVKYLPHKNELCELVDLTVRNEIQNKEEAIINIVNNLPKYTIPAGTRLFQICSRTLEPFEFKMVDTLSETQRGGGGFGSTGK